MKVRSLTCNLNVIWYGAWHVQNANVSVVCRNIYSESKSKEFFPEEPVKLTLCDNAHKFRDPSKTRQRDQFPRRQRTRLQSSHKTRYIWLRDTGAIIKIFQYAHRLLTATSSHLLGCRCQTSFWKKGNFSAEEASQVDGNRLFSGHFFNGKFTVLLYFKLYFPCMYLWILFNTCSGNVNICYPWTGKQDVSKSCNNNSISNGLTVQKWV